jgi:hypothetical protein
VSESLENRVKSLELALKHLQSMQAEHFESLTNDLSNRSESQFNLLKYLFKQYQVLKELSRVLASKLEMNERQFAALLAEIKAKMQMVSIEDEFLSETQWESEGNKDNVGS